MIYRNKRLDDNGPMGASLIDLEASNAAFRKYIEILTVIVNVL